jgi:hypothetical protein
VSRNREAQRPVALLNDIYLSVAIMLRPMLLRSIDISIGSVVQSQVSQLCIKLRLASDLSCGHFVLKATVEEDHFHDFNAETPRKANLRKSNTTCRSETREFRTRLTDSLYL